MGKKKKQVILGGIIKHDNGIGFKITFENDEDARYYKEMIGYVIGIDNFNIINKKGYYDEIKTK